VAFVSWLAVVSICLFCFQLFLTCVTQLHCSWLAFGCISRSAFRWVSSLACGPPFLVSRLSILACSCIGPSSFGPPLAWGCTSSAFSIMLLRFGLPLRRSLGVRSAFELRLSLGFDYFVQFNLRLHWLLVWLSVGLVAGLSVCVWFSVSLGLAVGWVGHWAFGPRLAFSVTWLVSFGLWLSVELWLGVVPGLFGVTCPWLAVVKLVPRRQALCPPPISHHCWCRVPLILACGYISGLAPLLHLCCCHVPQLLACIPLLSLMWFFSLFCGPLY
jgi:hypothetical protein